MHFSLGEHCSGTVITLVELKLSFPAEGVKQFTYYGVNMIETAQEKEWLLE